MRRAGARSSTRGGVAGKNFSEVESPAAGQLRDLLTAAEPVGDGDCGRAGGLHGGKQALGRDCLGYLNFPCLKANWPRHSATASLNEIDRCSGRAEKRDFARGTAKNGLVMAVTVDQDVCSHEAAGGKLRCALREPVGQ